MITSSAYSKMSDNSESEAETQPEVSSDNTATTEYAEADDVKNEIDKEENLEPVSSTPDNTDSNKRFGSKTIAAATLAVKNVHIGIFNKEKKDKDRDIIKVLLFLDTEDAKPVDDFFSLKLTTNENMTADDASIIICQKLGIGPVARQLFALKMSDKDLFLSPASKIKANTKDNVFEFRIRFKMANVSKLQKLDLRATEYLYQQTRYDLIKDKIIDLEVDKYKSELMGLVVLDMYRVILEKDVKKDVIMKDYVKYVPKQIFMKHLFFTKKPISKSLNGLCEMKSTVTFVRNEYLNAFSEIGQNYPCEVYKAQFREADETESVSVKITPFHATEPGIRVASDPKRKIYKLICTIEDLCFISIGEDNTVEISRKNGIPLYLNFESQAALISFVSLLDGYYRMIVKWTFNLCKDLPTQSLLKLYINKCHGPIGGKFSYFKLEQKRNNSPGCYILRECDKKYNELYIDLCTKNKSKPQSFKIVRLKNDEYLFNDDVTRYKSLAHLIKSYSDQNGAIYLKECLPPSEYDDSPFLLLCKPEKPDNQVFSNELKISDLSSFRSLVINARELQVFKSFRFRNSSDTKSIKTNGILNSKQFTDFFIRLKKSGLLTLMTKNKKSALLTLNLTFSVNSLTYYGLSGQGYLWKLGSCEKKICEIHTTLNTEFVRWFMLIKNTVVKRNSFNYELKMFIRSSGSAQICFRSSPVTLYPQVIIEFSNVMNTTRISVQSFRNSYVKVLQEKLMFGEFLLSYQKWLEVQVMIVDDVLTLFLNSDFGLILLTEVKDIEIRRMRWFSVGSIKSVTFWTFFCFPPTLQKIIEPIFPDCIMHLGDAYKGSEWISEKGLPCIPWTHSKIPKRIKDLFSSTKELLSSKNYCRNPGERDTVNYCYSFNNNILERQNCSIKYCRNFGCKIAGTGNDFIGKLNLTSTGRTCLKWERSGLKKEDNKLLNNTLFPDKNVSFAENYCRNPSRLIGGLWCYTSDPKIRIDLCNVQDCSAANQDIILLRGYDFSSHIFILPHWKAPNWGFRFALKVWNPDVNRGFMLDSVSYANESGTMKLVVGADNNKRIALYYGDLKRNLEKSKENIQPHLIYSGKWSEFVLEIRRGTMILSRDFGGDTIFHWDESDKKLFNPRLINIVPLKMHTIGFYLTSLNNNLYENCLLFNTSDSKFGKLFSSSNKEISFKARGYGRLLISCYLSPDLYPKYLFEIDEIQSKISLVRQLKKVAPKILKVEQFQDLKLLQSTFWNYYKIKFSEFTVKFFINETEAFYFANELSDVFLFYWFSVGTKYGSVFWTQDCSDNIISEIDEDPIDGGWTSWSEWHCSEICGGGFGYKIRNCTNPKPNLNGQFCVGESIKFDRCNEYDCGDISVNTINLIKKKFRNENFHHVIDEGQSIVLENSPEIISIFSKESPDSYYIWVRNGHRIKFDKRITLINDNLKIRNSLNSDSGIYICFLFRFANKKKYPFRVISLSVLPRNITYDLEKNEDVYVPSYSLTLSSIYTELSQKWVINDSLVYVDYGIAPLSEISFERITANNGNFSGIWKCVIEERTLNKKFQSNKGIISVYRSIWRVNELKKIEVALKMLNSSHFATHLSEFLEIANQWAFLQTNSIVRLFGITIHDPVAMIVEYMKLGPLDEYLKKNSALMKPVELVEAASSLASALFYLEENNIVHGNIRCRKLFVASHTDTSFSVRLADPGIAKEFTNEEVSWIPCEFYSNLNAARKSKLADIWAVSTTLWEIFMHGKTPPSAPNLRMFFLNGKRLLRPDSCPINIYQIMLQCWNSDPHKRKNPQEILRDINRILYQAFTSRENHSYARVAVRPIREIVSSGLCESTSSLLTTEEANDEFKDDIECETVVFQNSQYCRTSDHLKPFKNVENVENPQTELNLISYDSYTMTNTKSNLQSQKKLSRSITSIESIQSVIEFDLEYNIVLQGRIGQGFYGEVFKGLLECIDDKTRSRRVAIKKLKTSGTSPANLMDFEREITIMKSLNHENIVEILGVVTEPEISLVMEYLDHGSLQCYLKIHKESLTIPQLLKYALDVAKGMHYLGEKHIVHRDLAARNILVVNENQVKISDFGLAQVLGSSDYYILQTSRDLPIKWYSLESLRDGKFSSRTDVWSYGVTLCEMFSHGEEPQIQNISTTVIEGQEQDILLRALEQGCRYPCPPFCPQGIYVRIIHPCWQSNPHDRPGFKQLCDEVADLLQNY